LMRLYFLRHGKAKPRAGWHGDDGLRPLTDVGEAVMRREAVAIRLMGLTPDVILTSPLIRARRTAEIVAEELGMLDRMVEDDRLSHGFDGRMLAKIVARRAGVASIMFVGHEPEFSATVAEIIGGGRVDFKKGGLARVDVPGDDFGNGVLAWLLTPAQLTGE
jgi:phosphohistidine phosphatase